MGSNWAAPLTLVIRRLLTVNLEQRRQTLQVAHLNGVKIQGFRRLAVRLRPRAARIVARGVKYVGPVQVRRFGPIGVRHDKSSHRPMRGMAAQQFAFALLMVATNMNRIIEFEHQLHILDKRTKEGRAPQPRKQKHERLQRRRDRLGRSNYKRNPDPVKLVPIART